MNIIKRLIYKIWDPDYTKLTPDERARLEAAEHGEMIPEEEVWRMLDND